jgi:hypothetical protein
VHLDFLAVGSSRKSLALESGFGKRLNGFFEETH